MKEVANGVPRVVNLATEFIQVHAAFSQRSDCGLYRYRARVVRFTGLMALYHLKGTVPTERN